MHLHQCITAKSAPDQDGLIGLKNHTFDTVIVEGLIKGGWGGGATQTLLIKGSLITLKYYFHVHLECQ